MTKESPFPPYPRQTKSTGNVITTDRYDPTLLAVISEYQEWHNGVYGYKPSRATLLAISLLQQNESIRLKYLKRRKEEAKRHGRKTIDDVWRIQDEEWDDI